MNKVKDRPCDFRLTQNAKIRKEEEMTVRTDVTIAQITKQDIPGAIDLVQRVFSPQEHFGFKRDRVWWKWKYESNVFGEPIIIVAKVDDEEIVGLRAFWPWELVYRGRLLKAYQAVETVVDSRYRGIGLFRRMNEAALDASRNFCTDLIFNFPNKHSIRGNLQQGWVFLGKLEWSVKPLKPVKALFSLMSKTKFMPVDMPEKMKISRARFNELPIQKNGTDLIHTSLSEAFLSWRYVNHPFFRYGIITVSLSGESMAVIFSINESEYIREMIVTDLIGSPLCLKKAFDRLVQTAKSLDVDIIAAINERAYPIKKELWKYGFFPVKRKNFTAFALDPQIRSFALDIRNWNLSGGMHDTL